MIGGMHAYDTIPHCMHNYARSAPPLFSHAKFFACLIQDWLEIDKDKGPQASLFKRKVRASSHSLEIALRRAGEIAS